MTATDHAPQPDAAVQGGLFFIRPQDAKPVFHSSALTGGEPEIFFEIEKRTVPIGDMRRIADALDIDREGFELLHHPTAVADLYDDAAIDSQYYVEIEALLQQRFNAGRAVIFDVTRRSDGGTGAENRDGLRGPAWRVHVDYTVKSGPQRVCEILGAAEVARLETSGARIFQVNIWRPIRGPVARAPLAVADASSVRPEELIATDQVFPDRVGEIYHLAHAPTQRWYFTPRMTRDEVVLIKGWDSLDDGRAKFTPHCAFELPGMDDAAPPRESIELRALVIIE